MKKILLYILIFSSSIILSMELQRPLLLDYTFAVCPPENLIENLQQHACMAKNFDKTGKLFQELVYNRFSTQDLEYLVQVISSGQQVSAATALHYAVGSEEQFQYASVAMILQHEKLLNHTSDILQKTLDEDRQKYILRKKNIFLYLNPFNRNKQQVGELYWKLVECRSDRRNRNTLFPEHNQLLPACKVSEELDFFEDLSESNDLTTTLLSDLENHLIHKGLIPNQQMDVRNVYKECMDSSALCSSVIPPFNYKFMFHEGMTIEAIHNCISMSPVCSYSNNIAKLNNQLVAIDKDFENEKNKLVQMLVAALESRSNYFVPVHSNSIKSVQWHESVQDSKQVHRVRRSKCRKK